MNQNTYAIAIVAIFGFTALSSYFEDSGLRSLVAVARAYLVRIGALRA